MVGHGGSSAGSYLADPASCIPSHCASIVPTSTVRVKSFSYIWIVWVLVLCCLMTHGLSKDIHCAWLFLILTLKARNLMHNILTAIITTIAAMIIGTFLNPAYAPAVWTSFLKLCTARIYNIKIALFSCSFYVQSKIQLPHWPSGHAFLRPIWP